MKKKELPISLFIHLALYGFLCLYYMFNRPHWAYELDGGVSSYFETAIVVLFLVNLFLLYRFFRSNSDAKSVRVCSIAGIVLLLVFSVLFMNTYQTYYVSYSNFHQYTEIDEKIELGGKKRLSLETDVFFAPKQNTIYFNTINFTPSTTHTMILTRPWLVWTMCMGMLRFSFLNNASQM